MKYFTADYHFAHANIIKYCNRPFQNTGEMDAEIISRHNSRVSPSDEVYFLGDFVFKGVADLYLQRLNGRFTFIRGNHDGKKKIPKAWDHFWLKPYFFDTFMVFLIHDYTPNLWDRYVTEMADRADVILCGHSHEHWKFKQHTNGHPVINVGVDQWDFYPVSLDTITKLGHK